MRRETRVHRQRVRRYCGTVRYRRPLVNIDEVHFYRSEVQRAPIFSIGKTTIKTKRNKKSTALTNLTCSTSAHAQRFDTIEYNRIILRYLLRINHSWAIVMLFYDCRDDVVRKTCVEIRTVKICT